MCVEIKQTHSGKWWRQFYRGLYRVRQNNLCYYCRREMTDVAPHHLTLGMKKADVRAQFGTSVTLEHKYPKGHPLRGKTQSGWAAACYECNQREGEKWQKFLMKRESCAESTSGPMAATAGTGA